MIWFSKNREIWNWSSFCVPHRIVLANSTTAWNFVCLWRRQIRDWKLVLWERLSQDRRLRWPHNWIAKEKELGLALLWQIFIPKIYLLTSICLLKNLIVSLRYSSSKMNRRRGRGTRKQADGICRNSLLTICPATSEWRITLLFASVS